ncbi:MAG: hypothetical protein IIV79_04420 [Clostridia bacterium]|nr:hypothetical protein [Clostridia bacterium]
MAATRRYCCNKYVERVIEEYPHEKFKKAVVRLSEMPPSDPRINTDRIYQRMIFNREAVESAMNRILWYPNGEKIFELLQMVYWSKTHSEVQAALELNMLPQDAEKLLRQFRVILYDELGLILP